MADDSFDSELRLRTRSECVRAYEKIVNWLKSGKIDPHLGNAMINAAKVVLQSKTAVEGSSSRAWALSPRRWAPE
jgi:hypothetical protein